MKGFKVLIEGKEKRDRFILYTSEVSRIELWCVP